jgi:hypothetical protein
MIIQGTVYTQDGAVKAQYEASSEAALEAQVNTEAGEYLVIDAVIGGS